MPDLSEFRIDHQRTINSFELVDATVLVDAMNASRWCGARNEDRNDYSETETEHLATIEEDVPGGIDDLADLLIDFIEEELG